MKGVSHWLQLTVAGVRDALSLECFLGRTGSFFVCFFVKATLDALLLLCSNDTA